MGSFIRRNVPNYPWFAYDMEQLKKSIDIVMKHCPKKIYASHGGPFTPEMILQRFKHDLR